MRKKETNIIHALQKTVDELKESKLIDPLTGLLNREGFKNALDEKCKSNVEFLVAYADLDKFKEINDFMGHSAGDLVLKISSARMSSILGINSHVARLGGDEFAFVIPGEKNVAMQRCQELIERIKQPITLGDNTFSIGISIGVS
ncbi:TPA: GGDEF domain-containing protein, partial [Aeromonas veronii]|nr:GGDEF domain-containing protein [Aeromonas veronii]HDO1368157.1 GGDEF domain-containing protein [Aeromonas veronii]HDO1372718.1 GGDEF domain-containing protein [Aeromonas veronii]